jgi:uncharacterized membrane protein YeaQ/YmgE (transglycosylase-associated protein family)
MRQMCISLLFIQENKMIDFIIWIIVGGALGWLASIIMKTNSRQGMIADVIVGIVGAFVGGYFLSPLFNVGIPRRRCHFAGDLQVVSQYWRFCGGSYPRAACFYICHLLANGIKFSVLYPHQGIAFPAITLPQVAEKNTPQAYDVPGEYSL